MSMLHHRRRGIGTINFDFGMILFVLVLNNYLCKDTDIQKCTCSKDFTPWQPRILGAMIDRVIPEYALYVSRHDMMRAD